MNTTRKSELKQSVIAALSTFPCPVTVPEILNKLDRAELTRPALTELLEEMTLEGEAEKFPVERYACHHVWTANEEERRCSRCHRVEPLKPIEQAIIPEIIDSQEPELDSLLTLQQDKEELLRIESELRAIQEDFIVKSGERYQYIMETKLYQSVGYKNFRLYCSERLGIGYRQVYRLIEAAKVINNLKTVTNCYIHYDLRNLYIITLARCVRLHNVFQGILFFLKYSNPLLLRVLYNVVERGA